MTKSRKAQVNRAEKSLSQNAVPHSRRSMTQGVTQAAAQAAAHHVPPGPAHRPQTPSSHARTHSGRRPAGPYLQRRGRMYYFRKRFPQVLAKNGGKPFLCLSLRTPLLSEAMSRAARLLAVLELEEISIMTDPIKQAMSGQKITALLTEATRQELGRILFKQDQGAPLSDDAIDARIERLDQECTDLKRRARRNDYSAVTAPLRAAASAAGIELPEEIPQELGRQAVALFRELKEIEAKSLDGHDARSEAKSMVSTFTSKPVDEFVSSRSVLLSDSWQQALNLYPSKHMKGNIDAIAKLALEFFGDVPVTSISETDQKRFFAWMARLPKKHGKAHGENRFTVAARRKGEPIKERKIVKKNDEIAAADLEDEIVTEEIRAREDISDLEKRALLAEKLKPRLTMTTIRRNRDGLNRMFRGAADLGCKDIPKALSYKQVELAIAAAAPDDPLYMRVTQPKIRMPWTEERIAQFLTCPIYTGCASPRARWRPGDMIIRDAFYWVPLLVLTLGSRIEEILLLKRKNLRLRNHVHCLALGAGCDVSGKTEDAERIVPVPQTLLDLGFVDWIRALDEDHGPLLFPEIARRTATGNVTEVFSKSLRIILSHLDLADFDEDFYAMRKTLSSILKRAKVDDGQRQALAGHKNGSILNLHYTAHHTQDLKAAVDKADFKIAIGYCAEHGHPVIKSCGLAPAESFAVDVVLSDDGEAEVIRVSQTGTEDSLFEFSRRKAPGDDDRSPREVLLTAAKEFRKIVGNHPLRLPRSPLKRAAVEYFHALG
ncbi:DUF6538 domain-containing protein [Phaeobacter italicus]|uniref:DUF6538 domain-containing protein n=1 Tax=Phaeobacter italicus TaxID=481446 RepID=UPI002FE0F157